MDKYKAIQIVSWIVVAIVLIGMAVWFLTNNHLGSRSTSFQIENLRGPYEEVGRYNIDASNLDSIDLGWISGGIAVKPYDGNEIELIEYAQRSLEEDEILIYETTGNTLVVDYCINKTQFLDSVPSKKLEVFLPAAIAGNLSDFILNNVSSSIRIEDIAAKNFTIDSVSGQSEITGIKAEKIKINSTSGTIDLTETEAPKVSMGSISGRITGSDVKAEDLSFNTTSGNVNLEEVTTKAISFDTVSGEVTFRGTFEDLKAESTSGEYKVTDEVVPNSFKINTVSGDVNLTMPTFEGFTLKHDTVSGKFNCDIPVKFNGDGGEKFRVSTTSGDLTIEEY